MISDDVDVPLIFNEIKSMRNQLSRLNEQIAKLKEVNTVESDSDNSDIQCIMVRKLSCKDCQRNDRPIYREKRCRNCYYHANGLDLALVPRKCTLKPISYVYSPEKEKTAQIEIDGTTKKRRGRPPKQQDRANFERDNDFEMNYLRHQRAIESASTKNSPSKRPNDSHINLRHQRAIESASTKNSPPKRPNDSNINVSKDSSLCVTCKVETFHVRNKHKQCKTCSKASIYQRIKRPSKISSKPADEPKSLLDMINERPKMPNVPKHEEEVPLKSNRIVCPGCKQLRIAFKNGKCYECQDFFQPLKNRDQTVSSTSHSNKDIPFITLDD